MQSPSILIVGAGPTGLVLAISLVQNGVNVRIIEKDRQPKIGQRGAGMQPRTMEMHNLLGTLPDLMEYLSPLAPMRAYHEGNPNPHKTFDMLSGSAEPSDAFPITRAMGIGQDKQVEILTAHQEKFGGHVELGTELRSFEQASDHVVANLVHTGDNEEVKETAVFDYVIGADGAHSSIRKQLGLTFLGETRKSECLVIGDIHIPEGVDPNFCHMWGSYRSVFFRPTGKKTPDLFSFFISGAQADLDKITSREQLIEAFQTITGLSNVKYGDLVWFSQYTPNIRMVDSFRRGRVFVAGDAAHVHSPTGGQGMNSGLQDSFNLGWKLALVVKGLAKPEILDSYNAERLPVIAGMLKLTSNLHGRLFTEGADAESIWERGGSLDQLGVNYRGSPIVLDERSEQDLVNNPYDQRQSGTLKAGDRAPNASSLINVQEGSKTTRLFDIFGSTYHTVLIFSSSSTDTQQFTEALKKYPTGTIRSILIVPADSPATENNSVDLVLVDHLNYAHQAYGVHQDITTIVAVRPDGVIGAICTSLDGICCYFQRLFI